MSDIRICENDGEPLVFTCEFTGAEYYCLVCEGKEGVFGARAPATPERQRRLDELTDRYEQQSASRAHRKYTPPPLVGEPGVSVPTCAGCGETPEVGRPLYNGKPREWYSRKRDGVTQFACSRTCIPQREEILPW